MWFLRNMLFSQLTICSYYSINSQGRKATWFKFGSEGQKFDINMKIQSNSYIFVSQEFWIFEKFSAQCREIEKFSWLFTIFRDFYWKIMIFQIFVSFLIFRDLFNDLWILWNFTTFHGFCEISRYFTIFNDFSENFKIFRASYWYVLDFRIKNAEFFKKKNCLTRLNVATIFWKNRILLSNQGWKIPSLSDYYIFRILIEKIWFKIPWKLIRCF